MSSQSNVCQDCGRIECECYGWTHGYSFRQVGGVTLSLLPDEITFIKASDGQLWLEEDGTPVTVFLTDEMKLAIIDIQFEGDLTFDEAAEYFINNSIKNYVDSIPEILESSRQLYVNTKTTLER